MTKEAIVKKLFTMQESIIGELAEKVELSQTMVDIDEEDTIDPEDYSHAYEAGEMKQLMKVQLNRAKRQLDVLNAIDFSERNCIDTGAYVETNRVNFLVGFSTLPFDVEGKHIVGISKDSPIYPVIVSKKAGSKFSFGGNDYEILTIQ